MARYRKKALIVTADIADTQQYIATLEGITDAKPGDYIITGVDNEQWAIKPKWFKESYTHLGGNQYQRKPQVLEAVRIDKEGTVSTPNGPITGDKGDYKVTGTKGEQWFVKPDIFDKTYELVKGGTYKLNKSLLQGVIEQIGIEAVKKSIGIDSHADLSLAYCDVHGNYAYLTSKGANCPTCPQLPPANGTAATEVEHFIDMNPIQDMQNPNQKINPYGL